MIARNNLFQLIKVLSRGELRYFRKYVSRHKRESNHLQLFKAISAMAEHDESLLESQLQGTPLLRQLPVAKVQLTQLILRSLSSYHYARSPAMQAREHLNQVELLFEKGLDEQCLRLLRKARKQAYKYDLFTSNLDLLRWEARLLKKAASKEAFSQLKDLQKEEKELVRWISQESELRVMHDELFSYRSQAVRGQQAELLQRLQAIEAHPLIEQKESNFSLFNIAAYCRVFLSHLLGREELTNQHFEAMLLNWEKHPHQIKASPHQYAMTYIGFLESADFAENTLILQGHIRRLRQQKWDSHKTSALVFFYTYYLELHHFISSGVAPIQANPDIEISLGLKKFGRHLSLGNQMSLIYNLVIYFTCKDQIAQAQIWNERILGENGKGIRKDIRNFAFLLELVFLYDLGEYSLLEYRVAATRRRITPKAQPMAGLLYHYLLVLIDLSDESLKEDSLSAMFEDFEKLQTDIFGLPMLKLWAKARLEGKPLASYVFG